MALAEFIQALQEQETIYSDQPKPSIRVIPPDQSCIKIIPPENSCINKVDTTDATNTIKNEQLPKTIKLKIRQKQIDVSTNNMSNNSVINNNSIIKDTQPNIKPIDTTNI